MKNPFEKTPDFSKACLSKIDFDEGDQEKISAWLENPRDILYIHSASGIGKTYLCAAITNSRIDSGQYCYYFSEMEFFDKLRSCISEGGSYSQKLRMICENDFIILDDLGSTRGDKGEKINLNDWQKEIHFAFLDQRVMSRLPTVITSNYSPNNLKEQFHDRYISRILAKRNTVIRLIGEDKRLQGL